MIQLLLALAVLCAPQDPPKPAATQPAAAIVPKLHTLTRLMPDGVTLSADHYEIPSGAEQRPLIVCLHMEGGSRAEFAPIAPRFAEFACSTLAIDLRTGKASAEVQNQTALSAAKVLSKSEFSNEEAFVDVLEALKWARELQPDCQIFLLGSGKSAALALVAAARDPACADAVFAFSPNEDVPGWSIATEVRKIAVPTYVTCDNTPQEGSRARLIGNSIDKKLRTMIIPTSVFGATRGASVLVQPSVELRDRHWSAVVRMILQIAPLAASKKD